MMRRWVDYLYLSNALVHIPLTAAVFAMGWQNIIAVTFLYSAYANFKTDFGVFQGRLAQRAGSEST